MTRKFNLLWMIFKWSLPLSLVLVPLVAIYGFLQPWQPASATLSSYPDQSAIMVGLGFRAQNETQISHRSYILFPSVLREPKIVTIQQINNTNPTVVTSRSGFIVFLGWLLISFIGTWWFWFRGASKNHLTHHSSGTPNGAP